MTPFGSLDERGLQLLGGQARVGEDPAETAGGHQRQVGHGRGRGDERDTGGREHGGGARGGERAASHRHADAEVGQPGPDRVGAGEEQGGEEAGGVGDQRGERRVDQFGRRHAGADEMARDRGDHGEHRAEREQGPRRQQDQRDGQQEQHPVVGQDDVDVAERRLAERQAEHADRQAPHRQAQGVGAERPGPDGDLPTTGQQGDRHPDEETEERRRGPAGEETDGGELAVLGRGQRVDRDHPQEGQPAGRVDAPDPGPGRAGVTDHGQTDGRGVGRPGGGVSLLREDRGPAVAVTRPRVGDGTAEMHRARCGPSCRPSCRR